jgi:hypothetical protein
VFNWNSFWQFHPECSGTGTPILGPHRSPEPDQHHALVDPVACAWNIRMK